MSRISKRTPAGRMIGAMSDDGLSRLANQLEEDIRRSSRTAIDHEHAQDFVAMEKEDARGRRLQYELNAVEAEQEARERDSDAAALDRHQLENGGHYSQEPT
jgi:hypothetical protein